MEGDVCTMEWDISGIAVKEKFLMGGVTGQSYCIIPYYAVDQYRITMTETPASSLSNAPPISIKCRWYPITDNHGVD